ncbi:MAG TPA: hypothetical protein VK809_08340 [Bacteroidia bacterium]|jgi:hypothetical protein|nr:hypothetical protein [Bacteroidia bacterium]
MKEFKYTILFSLLINVCFAQNSLKNKQGSPNDTLSYKKGHQTANEREYLEIRDRYIKYFQSDAINEIDDKIAKQENDSLIELEKRLHGILNGCRLNSIAKEGKINLETLFREMGFGMLDGLVATKDSMRIFCTSRNLFFDYFKKEKIPPLDNLTTENLEDLFNSAYSIDAHITNFSSSKISANNNFQAYSMVGGFGQDVGPFLPDYIFVFLADNHFIYMAEKPLKEPVEQIPECKAIWDSINLESQKAIEKYDASQLKDTASFNQYEYLDELAFDEYCGCFQRELKKEIQFEAIQKELETMVKYIMSGK